MANITYETLSEEFNSMTGEIKHQSSVRTAKTDNEEDYIKVYKYLNTVFAFKNIKLSLVPALMEISSYMTFADKGQTVVMHKGMKEEICKTLGIGLPRLDIIIRDLKKADILRPSEYRGVYAINPFVVARGKWSDIKQLRSTFDFDAGLLTTQSIVNDTISGKTIAQIVQEKKSGKEHIPGQLSLPLELNEVQDDE